MLLLDPVVTNTSIISSKSNGDSAIYAGNIRMSTEIDQYGVNFGDSNFGKVSEIS
jgi:hypothetical protein